MYKFEKGTFTIVPNKGIMRGQSPTLQAVYFWICDHADEKGVCFPSYERLAECAGVDRRTVMRKVEEMVELGVLKKTVRTSNEEHQSNLYQVMVVGGSVIESPPSVTMSPELNPLNSTNTPVSAEIGISPSQSPENEEDTEEAEEDTTVVACDDEGNPLTYNGLGRQKGTPKKDSAYKDREEMIKVVEKTFNKRFLARPKQHSAIKTMLAMGVTTSEMTDAIYKLVEKPFFKENGWDFHSVLSEISKK